LLAIARYLLKLQSPLQIQERRASTDYRAVIVLIKYIVEYSIISVIYLTRENSVDWRFFRKGYGRRFIYTYLHSIQGHPYIACNGIVPHLWLRMTSRLRYGFPIF